MTTDSKVATRCTACDGDIGLWVPGDLGSGYTHIRDDGGSIRTLDADHKIDPTDFVPFPPGWPR
jgi:hypothetical protein